jgi:uncharacterized protein (DUF427 family)
MSELGQLRYEPTAKRIRALSGGKTVVDTTRAVLLWEPRRIVPSYAVPVEDIRADLAASRPAAASNPDDLGHQMPDVSARPVLDPSIPFTVHTCDGEPVDIVIGDRANPYSGFRIEDDDLPGYIALDFAAFDAWYEEDQVNWGHPKDPFHRIDVLASSRQVRLEIDGEVLAQSSRPVLLFETLLPTRYYLPPQDVRVALVPSQTRTLCAYKGQASYWSARLDGRSIPDLAWTYQSPSAEAAQIRDLVAFFTERVDLVLDGTRIERPVTPWSRAPTDTPFRES